MEDDNWLGMLGFFVVFAGIGAAALFTKDWAEKKRQRGMPLSEVVGSAVVRLLFALTILLLMASFFAAILSMFVR